MAKRSRPVDLLPAALPPRGLSRVLAAGYIGVSVGLFDEMVADGRMPQPKKINTRKVWDRIDIDRHFEALGTSEWAGLEEPNPLESISDKPQADTRAVARELGIPEDPTEWQAWWKERERLWRIEVVASPLQKRELMALAGLYEFRSEKVREIKGASIGTMERLLARGFVELDGEPPPGKCGQHRITEAGEAAWISLPESIRKSVTFETSPPFKYKG